MHGTDTRETKPTTMTSPRAPTCLATLGLGQRAVITAVGRTLDGEVAEALERRLLEIGFEEGREVEVRHFGPFGGDPIAVRVDNAIVAVRRKEAAYVLVAPLDKA